MKEAKPEAEKKPAVDVASLSAEEREALLDQLLDLQKAEQ